MLDFSCDDEAEVGTRLKDVPIEPQSLSSTNVIHISLEASQPKLK